MTELLAGHLVPQIRTSYPHRQGFALGWTVQTEQIFALWIRHVLCLLSVNCLRF